MESKERDKNTKTEKNTPEPDRPAPDIAPGSGGNVRRVRGGRELPITIGTQSAFTEEGELTTVPVVPNARGKPRPLQPREMQGYLASQGLGDPQVNEMATRQRLAVVREQARRKRRKPKST